VALQLVEQLLEKVEELKLVLVAEVELVLAEPQLSLNYLKI
jgi:hypothetical protein